MNPLSIPLPVAVRRHGEIVGIVAGIACFPIALYAGAMESLFPNGPTALVLPIVILTALAGAIASVTADESKAPEIGGVPFRVGARAGFIASLVAGALTVLASTFHSFGIGSPASVESAWGGFGLFLPSSPASRVIVLALLALPPSIFFGLTGALLAGTLKTNAPSLGEPTATQSPVRQERSTVFLVALLLTFAGYFSPLLVVLKPKPAPVVIVTPEPVQTKVERPLAPTPPPVPAPPKWRYEKPVGFDAAEAGRISLKEWRNLGEVASQFPVAMSPNGLRFAYFRHEGGMQIQVTDLETLDVIASTQMTATPRTMAWSPDSKMLLITTEDRGLVVFAVTSSRLIPLPLPRGARVPEGLPNWWDENEVLFAHSGASVSVLNLDTLRTAPPDVSQKWKAMTDSQRKEARAVPGSILPRNERWEMRVEAAVRRYDVPLNPSADWPVQESLQVAFVHSQKASRFVLPPVDVNFGDYLAAANDGSKLIRIRDNNAVVFFFSLRAEPTTRFKITIPTAPDASLTAALAKNNVAAFICSPAVNPLNGKTVAPDRDQVKAIARIASWQDKEAEFWVDENYLSLKPGDVVADLHIWNERTPHAVGELGKSEWFAVIEKFDTTPAPPARSEATALDRIVTLAVDSRSGADHLERGAATRSSKQQQPVPTSPPAEPQRPTEVTAPQEAPVAPKLTKPQEVKPPQDTPETIVRRFIAAHCEKANRYDAAGYANDFSDPVDYYSRGMESRASILRDVLNAQASNSRLVDTVKSITITQLSPTKFDARCTIHHASFKNGQPTGVVSVTNLTVELTPAGPKIIKTRAVN